MVIAYDKKEKLFRLNTESTSYWFRVTAHGHLEQVYYGERLPDDQSPAPLVVKRTTQFGSSVLYAPGDDNYCLDSMCLEWSGTGTGDYRQLPLEIKMPDGSYANDFIYRAHALHKGSLEMQTLPAAYGEAQDCETLEIQLKDKRDDVALTLYYTVYPKENVITRRAVLRNDTSTPLPLRRIMSMSLDLPNRNFTLVTFDGGWAKEANRHDRPVQYGIYVNASTTGASSNKHNPGFLLAEQGATEDSGRVYGFNLVYSGNHYSLCELSEKDLVRVQTGINPHCFEWTLKPGERFETPEAVLSFSGKGFNGLSANMHDFVNEHIVRGPWKDKERPVLLNNWEATFFQFTRGKLIRMARRAKRIGAEMFVLDDGWFGDRDSDHAGLGDYRVNRKKLPRGLKEFADKIHGMGLRFGLWVEPEMVNEDSDLYRAHPEYAMTVPGRVPAKGRNQLVLDLCNPAVRDYIVHNVSACIDEAGIDYIKWDMNRHISDAYSRVLQNQGECYHRYILGLYDILGRIFRPRPQVLLESCSSGGNRFDLGMLCYSPQIWASDDTDPIERLKIQGGLSYLYPLSAMGAHVSEAPHQQTLRDTALSTRFNVSSFGCLGYELDLKYLNRQQLQEVREQVAFYKEHRRTLQYGRFLRGGAWKDNKLVWHCVDKDGARAVTGLFQTVSTAAEGFDRLRFAGLDADAKYSVETKPQRLPIRRFGGLVKHILPVALNPDGFVLRAANKFISLPDAVERYEAYGAVLMDGLQLNNQFIGFYYNDKTRLLGDFGSSLYVVEKEDNEKAVS